MTALNLIVQATFGWTNLVVSVSFLTKIVFLSTGVISHFLVSSGRSNSLSVRVQVDLWARGMEHDAQLHHAWRWDTQDVRQPRRTRAV